MGRLLKITLAMAEAVSYRYDGVGNRTHTIYPDGKTVVYAYNDLNQVTSINDWDSGATTYEYDVNSRPITITLPNDTVSSLNYDAAGNVTSIVHKSDVGQVIGSYSYSYDATGRRLGAIENGTTISYTYDALYRLTDADHSNGNLYHYEYDAAGNRLLKQEPGETVVYTYDSANQLTHVGGAPTTLDANGNLLNDGNRSYAYDDLDRLIQVTQGITSTQYGYTGDGDRLWQKTDGVTTTFTLDLNGALAQVLAQSQGSALTTVNFLPGIGQQQSGGYWTYFHADALGSVRDLSGVTGNAIGHVDYSPFGEIVNSTGMASWFGFTGEQQDGASGLTYLRARYYDPALGRFLTPDSLIPDITNGQALNAYAYVYNDPTNFVDPGGHNPFLAGFIVSQLFQPGLGLVGDGMVLAATHAPDSWKPSIDYGSQFIVLNIDWWYNGTVNCDCEQESTNENIVDGANQLSQLSINGLSRIKGYEYLATVTGGFNDTVVFTDPNYNITKWGASGPIGDSRYVVNSIDDGFRVTNAEGAAFINAQNVRRSLPGSLAGNLAPIIAGGLFEAGAQVYKDWFTCISADNMFARGLVGVNTPYVRIFTSLEKYT